MLYVSFFMILGSKTNSLYIWHLTLTVAVSNACGFIYSHLKLLQTFTPFQVRKISTLRLKDCTLSALSGKTNRPLTTKRTLKINR